MTMTILYLIMVQDCNILHKKLQPDLTKIEGVAAIFCDFCHDGNVSEDPLKLL